MQCVVLTGDDDAAISTATQELLAGTGRYERLDLTEVDPGSLLQGVATPAMFGPRSFLVEGLEGLSPEELDTVLVAAPRSDAVVVIRARTLPPKIRSRLAKLGEIRKLELPKGGGAPKALGAEAARLGVRLDGPARELLGSVPYARGREALDVLSQAGMRSPDVEDIRAVLGEDVREAPPWELTDALDRRELAQLVDLCAKTTPVVAVNFLVTHLTRLGQLLESQTTTTEEAMALLGLPQRFVAERALSASRRIAYPDILSGLDLLGALALSVRSTDSSLVLEAGMVSLFATLYH